jgi:soluble lytic murein transglycosylase-like protein
VGALRLVAALALAAAPVPAAARQPADPVARWQPLIDEAAARFALPPAWIARVMRAESAGRTHQNGQPIRSRAGAIGLMQLMPATWAAMRAAHRLGHDPDDPGDNVMAGAAYLRLMYDRFGYPGLFAAYNAGPGRYAAYLEGRARLPGETRAYLASVAGTQDGHAIARADSPVTAVEPPRQSLFLLRFDGNRGRESEVDSTSPGGLFVIRRGEQ